MWIEDYRIAHGLELDDLARKVNTIGREIHYPWYCTVTDTLIHILERSKVPRTHPIIADAIAAACEATQEQRDSIVDEKHRGVVVKAKPRGEPVTAQNGDYSVVMVDMHGNVLRQYGSARTAAIYGEMCDDSIQRRCNHKIKNEFDGRDYTYRYAAYWNKLTPVEKLRDLGVDVVDE